MLQIMGEARPGMLKTMKPTLTLGSVYIYPSVFLLVAISRKRGDYNDSQNLTRCELGSVYRGPDRGMLPESQRGSDCLSNVTVWSGQMQRALAGQPARQHYRTGYST